ncbi:MAG: class I SAM-dependent methyltransferase [Candidatus Portnoybacteria bacterium]|nr:class I SAM-dependent methyltransferase [Candidatus Portnoybacteria bacterium]
MNEIQKDFWFSQSRMKRRSPFHPAVAAFVEPKVKFLVKNIFPSPTMTLLDVGCGNGYFTCHLAKFFDVTGLDFSPVMLQKNPHKKLVQGDANVLPFGDKSFDVVFCSDLLHHLPDPEKAVKEMTRVAKNFVAISEPNRNNPLMFLFGLLKKEERGSLKFTKKFLSKILAAQGLRLEKSLISGMIFPNKTPRIMVPFFKIFDFNFPFGSYITTISKR